MERLTALAIGGSAFEGRGSSGSVCSRGAAQRLSEGVGDELDPANGGQTVAQAVAPLSWILAALIAGGCSSSMVDQNAGGGLNVTQPHQRTAYGYARPSATRRQRGELLTQIGPSDGMTGSAAVRARVLVGVLASAILD